MANFTGKDAANATASFRSTGTGTDIDPYIPNPNVSIPDGSDANAGGTADAVIAAGAAGSVSAKLRAISRDIVANIVLKAGTAIIGKVGIDQTTPGTTDSVSLATGQGAGATIGTTGDATVAAGATGSLSAKLRRVTQGLEDLKTLIVLAAGELHIGQVGGHLVTPSATVTRPADTTQYASGELVANSTTAGSVTVPTLTVARTTGGSGMLRRVRFKKSGTVLTNASFRVHFYGTAPTVTNGDNGAWLSTQSGSYLGACDVTVDKAMSDGSIGIGVPVDGSEINFVATATTIAFLIEARAAYTPISAEVYTVTAEVLQN